MQAPGQERCLGFEGSPLGVLHHSRLLPGKSRSTGLLSACFVAKQANEHVVQADEWLARRQAQENIILEERDVKLRGENKKLIANVRQLAEVGVTSHEHQSIPRT